jgi:hypothetical protein
MAQLDAALELLFHGFSGGLDRRVQADTTHCREYGKDRDKDQSEHVPSLLAPVTITLPVMTVFDVSCSAAEHTTQDRMSNRSHAGNHAF